jgi:hypothetical protein
MLRRTMAMTGTIAALAGAFVVLALAVWGDRRPYRPGRPWRPWTVLMALALTAVLVLAGHLISLVTGTPFHGRSGP